MIVVRVGLGISTQDVTSYATTALNHTTRSGPTFALPMRFRQNTELDSSGYELDPRDIAPSSVGDKMRDLENAASK